MKTKTSALALVILLASALCASAQTDTAGVVAKAKPAIVTITTYDSAGKEAGLGTGFLADDSHVVTCYHVIEEAAKATVKTADGKTCKVKEIAASDRIADVAKLSLTDPIKGAKSLTLSKSLPKQGEKVVVVGSPMGLELTVSDGIVSAIRDIPGIAKMLQITAPISPGSSGSPVLNLTGQVVGVVTSYLAEGQNLNFAVASEQVLSLKPSSSALPGAPSSSTENKMWHEMRAGGAYSIQGDDSKALPHFKAATRLGPNVYVTWFRLGLCYQRLGRYSDAVDAYKQAIRIKPDDADAYVGLGMVLDSLRRYSDAVDAFRQAIRNKPDDADAYVSLAMVLGDLDRYSDAVDALKQAIRIKPDDAQAHYTLGLAFGTLDRDSEAVDAYKQAIRVKPEYADAHYMLGLEYLCLGDKGSALDEYKILKPLDAKQANDLFNVIYK